MKKFVGLLLSMIMILSLVGCGKSSKEEVKNVPVKDIIAKLKDKIEVKGIQELPEEDIKNIYNLNMDEVEDAGALKSLVNVNANEVAIVKAKDGKVENIKALLETYGNNVEKQWSTYLPEQYELTKQRIINSKGNYVYLIIDQKAKDIEKNIEDALK